MGRFQGRERHGGSFEHVARPTAWLKIFMTHEERAALRAQWHKLADASKAPSEYNAFLLRALLRGAGVKREDE